MEIATLRKQHRQTQDNLTAAQTKIDHMTAEISSLEKALTLAKSTAGSGGSGVTGVSGVSVVPIEEKEALVEEVEALRGKLRRADKHYAVTCRAVEQLEGELKAQGDQYALEKINSDARCKKLQQQLQGLSSAQGLGLGDTGSGEWGAGLTGSGSGGGYSGGGGVLGLVDQGAISDQNSLAFQVTTTTLI